MRRSRFASSGSIPAGAGEPLPYLASRDPQWVYPRGCGGAEEEPTIRLPPRGSIPAGAGEPLTRLRTMTDRARVYPRGCGGARTAHHDPTQREFQGLSPRVRGSLRKPRAN